MRVRALAWGLAFLAMLAAAPPASANVRLPAVIGHNMVLQAGKTIHIWGWADPGEAVTVTLGDTQATTSANDRGDWSVRLGAREATNVPFNIVIKGKNQITLTNVVVGEVWVGSGQSNMQWSVAASANAQQEIAHSRNPSIRLFVIPLVPSGTPARNVNAQWFECAPETVAGSSAVLYYFGREIQQELKVPVGLITTAWGGTRIEPWITPAGFEAIPELKKEIDVVWSANKAYAGAVARHADDLKAWSAAAAAAAERKEIAPDLPALPNHPLNSNGAHTGLYNGMIAPIVPFQVRGALWYQGESNRGQGMYYHHLMRGLIAGWREKWQDPNLPFLFVQLAPFNYQGSPTALPEIWEAQTATLKVPHTGMAVTTDITTLNDIHPPNKQDVGKRLALWALADTYGRSDLEFSGPLYDSVSFEGSKARVSFAHAKGLKSSDGKPLTWFAVAGADKVFKRAKATIDGETVVVESPEVAAPKAVRFGWHQLATPNLVNGAGLPASPFRTDDWADATNFNETGG